MGRVLTLWAEDPGQSRRRVGKSWQPPCLLRGAERAPEASPKPPSSELVGLRCKEHWASPRAGVAAKNRSQEMLHSEIVANAQSFNIFCLKLPCILTVLHLRACWFCSVRMFWTMKISGSLLHCESYALAQ